MTARGVRMEREDRRDVIVFSDEIFEFSPDHPVRTGRETAHPKAVVNVTPSSPSELLEVLPHLGTTVAAGPLAGNAIFALTLVERATCPSDCPVSGYCCGNFLPDQRRLKIGHYETFYSRMEAEIASRLEAHPDGILVKLHELGDFASVEYVYFWHDMLEQFPKLAIFGSTHHRQSRHGGTGIGDAIAVLKGSYPSRFMVRWSQKDAGSDGMIVVMNHDGVRRRVLDALICPQHLGEKDTCGDCGLCFSESMKMDCIGFPKQGNAALTPPKHKGKPADVLLPPSGEPAPVRKPAPRPRVMPTFSGSVPTMAPRRMPGPEIRPVRLAPVERDVPARAKVEPARASGPVVQPTGPRPKPTTAAPSIRHPVAVAAQNERAEPKIETMKDTPTMSNDPQQEPTAADILADAPPPVSSGSVRRIEAVKLPGIEPATDIGTPPEYRQVDPSTLLVEESYQRNISQKSISLLRRIVEGWDWKKFKAPIVAETPEGLFVIDGQHTAIGAVTLGIGLIPVAIHKIETLAERAESFAAHNRERVAMTEFQVFHAQAVAGDPFVNEILQIIIGAGGHLPRNSFVKNRAPAGTVTAVTELRRIYRTHGSQVLRRIIETGVQAGLPVINKAILQGVRMVIVEPAFAGFSDQDVVASIRSFQNFDDDAEEFSRVSGQKKARAIAVMIRDRARQHAAAAAA